jgi:hypothetical protein
MGIAVSLILIAAGAILTWGVDADPEGLNVDAIGVVLMIVGLVSFILTMLFWQSWWGPGYFRRARYAEGEAPARRRYAYPRERRTTYVEEEEEPPPAGPP